MYMIELCTHSGRIPIKTHTHTSSNAHKHTHTHCDTHTHTHTHVYSPIQGGPENVRTSHS